MDITIRTTIEKDSSQVILVNREAFWNQYAPGCYEHYLVSILPNHSHYIPQLNLVALCDDKIVGHLMCMKSNIYTDQGQTIEVVTLGPLSVLPSFQNLGIGRKLVLEVQKKATSMGFKMILLCGDPLYYQKIGFENAQKYKIRTSDHMYSDALMVYFCDTSLATPVCARYLESESYDFDIQQAELFDAQFPVKQKLTNTPSQLRFKELISLIKPA